MSASSRAIKLTAKTALKGNWVSAIVVSTVTVLCYLAIQLILSVLSPAIGNTASFIVLFTLLFFMFLPVGMGFLRFFWRMLFSAEDNPVSVFYYFSSVKLYLKTLKLLGMVLLYAACVGFVLFLPAIAVWVISQSFLYDMLSMPIPIWSANLNYVFNLLVTTASAILIFIMIKFHLAPMLFVADDNIDVAEAIHMSKTISKKASLDFIFLAFSFIGWILLCFLCIPNVFVLPYIVTSYLVHSRFAVAEYNKHISENVKVDFSTYKVSF